ncbi:MAG: glycine C-acetyltransferase, partial [Gemmatimonadetes bacterium]|nr:glycine C-acetyltransferase [Gemmatimonadota bacterium]
MPQPLFEWLGREVQAMKEQGVYKRHYALDSPQDAVVTLAGRGQAINLCSNNYLGL